MEDIPGTEAWAVKEAATGALAGCELRVDCLPCVNAFKAGMQWATIDRRKHARVHRLMLQAWGDMHPNEALWMPAHTTEASVGVALLGEGTSLTSLDRRGNDQADTLAKKAANTHGVPESIRTRLQQQRQIIDDIAKWIGLVNHAAKKQPEAPHRDTSVTKAATYLSKMARK